LIYFMGGGENLFALEHLSIAVAWPALGLIGISWSLPSSSSSVPSCPSSHLVFRDGRFDLGLDLLGEASSSIRVGDSGLEETSKPLALSRLCSLKTGVALALAMRAQGKRKEEALEAE
jgi:hypothetical protein